MNRNNIYIDPISIQNVGNAYYLIYTPSGNYYVTPNTFEELLKVKNKNINISPEELRRRKVIINSYNKQLRKYKFVKNIRKNPRIPKKPKNNSNVLKEGSKVGNALAKKYLEKAPLSVIAKKFYNKAMNAPNFNTFIRTQIPGRTFSNENISKIYQKMYKIASGNLRANSNENQN